MWMTPTSPGIQQMTRVATPYFQVVSPGSGCTLVLNQSGKMRLKPWRKSVTASPKLTRMSKNKTLMTVKAAQVSRNPLSISVLQPLQLLALLVSRI